MAAQDNWMKRTPGEACGNGKVKARVWIENGVILCCSQVCEKGGDVCPRIEQCKVVKVTIEKGTPD